MRSCDRWFKQMIYNEGNLDPYQKGEKSTSGHNIPNFMKRFVFYGLSRLPSEFLSRLMRLLYLNSTAAV